MSLRFVRFITALLSLSILLVACGSPSGGGSEQSATKGAGNTEKLTTVKLALDWTPNTNHTGIYVAQEKGWYRKHGIDLQILPYSSSSTPELLVANGKTDLAISFVESMVLDRATGEKLVSLAAIIPHNTSALVTKKSSGLDRPRDLDGKTYAGFGSGFENAVVSRMIKCDGGKGDFKNITANLDAYQAFKTGKVDFTWFYMGAEGIQAMQDGMKLNAFYVNQYCVPDYPSPVIITSENDIKQKPDAIRRFMAATAQGYEWAAKHPDAAANLLIKGTPKGTFPNRSYVIASQKYLSPRYYDPKVQKQWGWQTLDMWKKYPQLMYKTGNVKNADHKVVTQEPDYRKYYTNKFLP